MKNRIIIVLMFILSCKTNKRPILKFQNLDKKIFYIQSGKENKIPIKIYNNGNDALIIEKHTCNCECTNLSINDYYRVPPKDSVEILATIKGSTAEVGKKKFIKCTLKTNSDSIFHVFNINYIVK